MTICTLSDALFSLTVGSNKLANSEIFHDKKINNSGRYLCIIYRSVEQNGYLLTDCFASTPINQARALAFVLNHFKEQT